MFLKSLEIPMETGKRHGREEVNSLEMTLFWSPWGEALRCTNRFSSRIQKHCFFVFIFQVQPELVSFHLADGTE